MARAIFNGRVIAESDDTVVVEGNHYFPRNAVRSEYLSASDRHTLCLWKGRASYFSVHAGGARAQDAAWYYASPFRPAARIEGRVAFGREVIVEASSPRTSDSGR